MTYLEYRQKVLELNIRHREELEPIRKRQAAERAALDAEYNSQDKAAQKAAKAAAIRDGKTTQAARNQILYWNSNPNRMWDFFLVWDFHGTGRDAEICQRACELSEGRYRYDSLPDGGFRITKL